MELMFPELVCEKFLGKLRTEKGSYKRYLGSPLRYAGGKSWAALFLGGAILRLRWLRS